eukprot:3219589-Pleurochrysis_carterae.AAC.12
MPAQVLRRGGFYRQLIATAGGWFFYDFAYYGNTLLQPRVLAAIFGGHKDLAAEASQNCVVALMGVGFTLVAIPLIVPIGTANLQVGTRADGGEGDGGRVGIARGQGENRVRQRGESVRPEEGGRAKRERVHGEDGE